MTSMETQDSSQNGSSPHLLREVLVVGGDGKQLATSGIAEKRELATGKKFPAHAIHKLSPRRETWRPVRRRALPSPFA